MKKYFILISAGVFNSLHGISHIVQFIQSMVLVSNSHHGCHEESFFNHPLFSLLWAVIGIATLVIGIKDYLHHRKCKH
jgi:hypothetical protein